MWEEEAKERFHETTIDVWMRFRPSGGSVSDELNRTEPVAVDVLQTPVYDVPGTGYMKRIKEGAG